MNLDTGATTNSNWNLNFITLPPSFITFNAYLIQHLLLLVLAIITSAHVQGVK